MAQQTTTVPAKTTGDELTASELNSINNVVNANSADSESRLTSLEGFAVAIIEDQKPNGTNGGSAVVGWQTRDLNTIVSDSQGIIKSLVSNIFELDVGTYLIEAITPAHSVSQHKPRLYNETDSVVIKNGMSMYADPANVTNTSTLKAEITLTSIKELSIQHGCSSPQGIGDLGVASSFGGVEVYTQVKITKLG